MAKDFLKQNQLLKVANKSKYAYSIESRALKIEKMD